MFIENPTLEQRIERDWNAFTTKQHDNHQNRQIVNTMTEFTRVMEEEGKTAAQDMVALMKKEGQKMLAYEGAGYQESAKTTLFIADKLTEALTVMA